MSSGRLRQRRRRWLTVRSNMLPWRTCPDLLLAVWSCPAPAPSPAWLRGEPVSQSHLNVISAPSPPTAPSPQGLRFQEQSCFLASCTGGGVIFQTWCRLFSCWTGVIPLKPCVLVSFQEQCCLTRSCLDGCPKSFLAEDLISDDCLGTQSLWSGNC